jgi:succinate dehydrogenase hydrophobic anchor subunit
VKPVGIRLALQVVVIAVLVAYLGWTIQVLWATP